MKNQNYINEYFTEVEISVIKYPLSKLKADLSFFKSCKHQEWIEEEESGYADFKREQQKLLDKWDLYIASRYTY